MAVFGDTRTQLPATTHSPCVRLLMVRIGEWDRLGLAVKLVLVGAAPLLVDG